MTKLTISDAYSDFVTIEGQVLEETKTYLTIRAYGSMSSTIVWKHNIIERIEECIKE